MRKPLPAVILILSCLITAGFLPAQSFISPGIETLSARTAAIGGIHAALADDIATLFANPAGFRSAGPQFSITEATLNLSGPIFSISDLVIRIMGGANPLLLLADPGVQALLTNLYSSGTLNGPLSFGYVGGGLGFGFFNSSFLSFSTTGTFPTVTASIGENATFSGGYAFGIPLPPALLSTLDVGVLLKAFATGSVTLSKSILEVFSLLASPSLDVFASQPFTLDVGIGVDVGVLYSWNKLVSVGIVGRNLYSPVLRNGYPSFVAFSGGTAPAVSYGTVPIDLSAGLLFAPGLGPIDNYITNFKVMLDYVDILDFLTHPDTSKNPLLHVGLGVELVVLEILSLRGGFSQGYFSAGLGMNLTYFRLNLAMYGKELSSEPGLRPVFNLLVGFEFRY